MRRYELVGRRQLRLLTDVSVPSPGTDEVLVRVRACTVCGRSDLAYFHYHGLRDHCGRGIFGHEVAGTIAGLGDGVRRFEIGERVFLRTPLSPGFADYVLARAISVGRLPDAIDDVHGASLQLLPLAVHASRGVGLGDRVLIVGQGPVGLFALQTVRLRGASSVVVTDIDPWRLARSSAFGADAAYATSATGYDELFGGDFDVAIDAAGSPATAQQCIDAVRIGGLVVFLGTHHVDTRVTFDLVQWEKKGLRLHTAAEAGDEARAGAMRVAERLVDRGMISLDGMITHTYPLDELPAAIEQLSASRLLYPEADAGAPFAGPPPRTLKVAICP